MSRIFLRRWIFRFWAHRPAPGRLNLLYLRKGWKIDFPQQIAETVTKSSFWCISKKCLDWADFSCVGLSFHYLWFCTPTMPITRSFLNRDVLKLIHDFKSWNRCDLSPIMSQRKNDASDWMKRSTASPEWYLLTGTGLIVFWKSIDAIERSSRNQKRSP